MNPILRLLLFWKYHDRDNSSRSVRRIYRVTIVLFLFCATGLGWQAWKFFQRQSQVHQNAIARGQKKLDVLVYRLETVLNNIKTITTDLARDVEKGDIKEETLIQRLQDDAKRERLLIGLGVAYQPYMHSPETRLYTRILHTPTGKILTSEVGDYTSLGESDQTRWYLEAVLEQRPAWVVSFGKPHKGTYLSYGVPFFRGGIPGKKGRVLGTVTAFVSLDALTQMLNKENVGRLGSGFLSNEEGVLLAHPNKEHLDTQRTLWDVGQAEQDKVIQSVARRMQNQENGVVYSQNVIGARVVHFFKPLSELQWSVGMTAYRGELDDHTEELRRRQIQIALTALATLVLFTVLATGAYHLTLASLRNTALVTSLLLLCVVVFVWYLAIHQSLQVTWNASAKEGTSRTIRIDDQQSLFEFVGQRVEQAKETGKTEPIVIPTGVLVQSLQFEGSNNVLMSGLVWQRYHINKHKDVKRGIVLPQVAPDTEEITIEKQYVEQDGEYEVVGWHFRVLLRLNLNYARYPFDSQKLALRIQHPEIGRNVILAADFDSYPLINTRSKPGLSEELVLPGWEVVGSYFTFEESTSNARFGLHNNTVDPNKPDLQFNVLTRREIITPFLSHMFPLVVVAALLFGVLLSCSQNEKRNSLLGFSTFGVLEICGAFFFAVVLVHIDLRATLNTDVITYVETLHLILYSALVMVSVVAYLFASPEPPPMIRHGENAFAKMSYWPVLAGLTLLMTVYFFY
ncbi:MAG: cache domain-containing protein [Gemmataceae bacterium]